MGARISLRGTGPAWPPDVAPLNVRWARQPESTLQASPRAHVLRLLLHPVQPLKLRIRGDQLEDGLERQRIQLFDTRDGDIGRLEALRREAQLVVDPPRTEKQGPDLVATFCARWIVDHGLEPAAAEVGEPGRRFLEAQQAFWREDEQRARVVEESLAAHEVKVLRGRRAVREAHVVVRAELQEAFDSRARVLRPRPVIAVGQQQGQAGVLPPFGAGRRDELVDDHLGVVEEVAVLRLPDDQGLRVRRAVAILEAETPNLAERTVE